MFGESSGERDGKEVRDLADGGVCVVELLDTYRRGLTRTVPDLWLLVDAVEVDEEVRSRWPSRLFSITEGYQLPVTQHMNYFGLKRNLSFLPSA